MDAHPFHKGRRRDDGEPPAGPPPAAEALDSRTGLLPGGPRPAAKGAPSLQSYAVLLVLCTAGLPAAASRV